MAQLRDLNPGDWVRPMTGKRWIGKVIGRVGEPAPGGTGFVRVEPYLNKQDLDCVRGGKPKTLWSRNLQKLDYLADYDFWSYRYPALGELALNRDYGFYSKEEIEEQTFTGWAKRSNITFISSSGINIRAN